MTYSGYHTYRSFQPDIVILKDRIMAVFNLKFRNEAFHFTQKSGTFNLKFRIAIKRRRPIVAFNNITQNDVVREDYVVEFETAPYHLQQPIDISKNLLICNVKKDNWKQYLDGSAKIYYTGKKFPTTVALNKLYYFMP